MYVYIVNTDLIGILVLLCLIRYTDGLVQDCSIPGALAM